MAFVTGADAMAQTRFVVEVSEPVPGDLVNEVAERIADRFAMDARRVRKLLAGRTGPVTKPVLEEKAELIARAFADAGVSVSVRPADEPAERLSTPRLEAERDTGAWARAGDGHEPAPANVFLSSTRWVPSPHAGAARESDRSALVEGSATAVLAGADDAADGAAGPSAGERERETGPPVGPTVPARRGPDFRIYLLIGFVVALVLFVALQLLNGLHPAGSAAADTVEAGMQAYGNGDFAQATRIWTPLAEAGNARAQYMLGYMAENGQGRPWSNHDAAAWYQRAADLGYPQAQVQLGQLYVRGMGVLRDPERAASLFKAAAEEGYGPGQFQYALALFYGSGVPQDFTTALRWFKAAAVNGVAEARPYVSYAGSASNGGVSTAPPAPAAPMQLTAPAGGASQAGATH